VRSFKAQIIKALRRQLRVPSGILLRYCLYKSNTIANKTFLVNKQAALFSKNHLDRDAGLNLVHKICLNLFNEEYTEDDGMFSEHLVICSSLSLSSDFKANNILEIGTFDGRTTAIFSNLFPKAAITTIDLEDESNKFRETYARSDKYIEFNDNRDSLLSKLENVTFKMLNSVNLTEWDANSFDLIWIDGEHGYPVIAMDIINALRLINAGGVILIDDVWTSNKRNDQMYNSIGAYQSLLSLHEAKAIDGFELFLKRIGPKHNILNLQKFVGFIKI
jgi:predicted O-methyltransferase YrrM